VRIWFSFLKATCGGVKQCGIRLPIHEDAHFETCLSPARLRAAASVGLRDGASADAAAGQPCHLRRGPFAVFGRSGSAVTMDYSAYRLNFWLDRRDVIERVTCG
jgi:hypothetical protein